MATDVVPITLTSATSGLGVVNLSDYHSAAIQIGSTWNTACVGLAVGIRPTGPFVPVINNSLAWWHMPAQASMAIPLPEVLPYRYAFVVSHSNQTLIAQAIGTTILIVRKRG